MEGEGAHENKMLAKRIQFSSPVCVLFTKNKKKSISSLLPAVSIYDFMNFKYTRKSAQLFY